MFLLMYVINVLAGKRSLEVKPLIINDSCLYLGLQGLRTLPKVNVNSVPAN